MCINNCSGQFPALSSSQAQEAGWSLAFPSEFFNAPFHIDNNKGVEYSFWLEYASKSPLEVVLRRMNAAFFFLLRG